MTLKIIALISMAIDHYGIILGNDHYTYRLIGRLAFPLFAYILVQNYIHHISSHRRYFMRLFIFAIISQPIFYFSQIGLFEYELNIIFTLLFGTLAIYTYENREKIKLKYNIPALFIFLLFASLSVFSEYSVAGFTLIISFYMHLKKMFHSKITYTLIVLSMMSCMGVFVFWITIPIVMMLIDGEKYIDRIKYNKKYKYLFYVFYPLHILILTYSPYNLAIFGSFTLSVFG